MKECPICHAMNGDGSETCYNCHASLSFKTYNAYQNHSENLKDYAVDKNTVVKYIDLIADNECLNNLNSFLIKGYDNNNISILIQESKNTDISEFIVFANDLKIGYIPKDKCKYFKLSDSMYDAAELFINKNKESDCLTATISVVFQKVSDSIADEYINQEVKICNHCGCSSNKISNGLCPNCNRSKIILKIVLFLIAFIIDGLIKTLFRTNGVLLGAIPTILILGVLLFLANFIPNRIYDKWN